ncbi:MAG TPA: 4Fe-4S dicluster domain-containing protein [Tepidisphaeraceae bacterium]|jgi:electron transport complex protein RnfC|nr:4Fe-4S dicluster domain-containing protein [Tepidisphaeraceae bacterium]
MTEAIPPVSSIATPGSWIRVRPSRIDIDLIQHGVQGKPATIGDAVRLGDRISGLDGGSIIAPVDGVIVDGRPGGVTIEVSPDYKVVPEPPHHDYLDQDTVAAKLSAAREADRGQWIDRIRAAGIVADRHGCPNLFEQLRQSLNRPIDAVVCCALDSESSLPYASTLVEQFAAEMMMGVALLAKLTGAATAIAAVDEHLKTLALAPARHWATLGKIRLDRLSNPYPQSDPTLLLYTLLERRLRPGRLPTEVGVILLDAPAAVAIGALLLGDRPMTDVFIAARDVMTRQVRRAYVPVGTDLTTALLAMGFNPTGATLRSGELLRDLRVDPKRSIGFDELTFHIAPPEPPLNPDPCVRCGWCVEICPPRIHPAGLLDAAQRTNLALADRHGLHACIECGLCTYVCPSKLPILRSIRELKNLARREAGE